VGDRTAATRDGRSRPGGPDPSPLEKLLVGRVVAGWLQVHYADAPYAQLRGAPPARRSTRSP
jgi:hypothetical protein